MTIREVIVTFEGSGGFERFLACRFFCEAGARPGFLAESSPSDPIMPIFTSEAQLARHRGPVAWFSTTGADLLDLVPAGHRLVVDQSSDTPVVLDPGATRRGVRLERVGT